MNRSDLDSAIEANQARLLALMNDLGDLHDRMPDKGVDPSPEELVLLAAIEAESAEMKRLALQLRAQLQRRMWFGVAGMVLVIVATFVAVLLQVRR